MSKETTNIPADFWKDDQADLFYIEEGIRAVEGNAVTAMAVLAISFGRIRREKMYLKVADSFKKYLKQRRTTTDYKQAIRLSKIGMNWWDYRNEMAENGIRLSDHMSKVGLLHLADFDYIPTFWENFKSFSYEKLERYLKDIRDGIDMYPGADHGRDVKVSGASIRLNGVKLKGLNLNEARNEVAAGRRAVVVWVNDDNEARRVRRRLEGWIKR